MIGRSTGQPVRTTHRGTSFGQHNRRLDIRRIDWRNRGLPACACLWSTGGEVRLGWQVPGQTTLLDASRFGRVNRTACRTWNGRIDSGGRRTNQLAALIALSGVGGRRLLRARCPRKHRHTQR